MLNLFVKFKRPSILKLRIHQDETVTVNAISINMYYKRTVVNFINALCKI